MGNLAGTLTAEPATSGVGMLAEILAEVMKAEQVPVDGHFFDELGADSLVMAKFCARVRKREDLPSVSMKDIYAHPTIRSLATAFSDAAPALVESPDPAPPEVAARVSTRQYLMCGALQALFFLGYTWMVALVGARAYEWISAAHGYEAIYLRSVVFGGAGFIVLCTLPILAKWVLIGRWEPQQIRVWSLEYFRFWIVKTLVRSNPLVLVAADSPLYTWYLRALGAKIGRGTVIFSRHVPICTDLLTIGPDTVIRKESFLDCYRAYGGWIQTGRVTIGRNVFIGEKTVLDINTSMGDVSQLGHASSLHSGQRVRTGERWHGSPAQRTSVNYLRVSSRPCGRWRRFRFSAVTLLCVFFLYLPLIEGGVFALLTAVPTLGKVLNPSRDAITTQALYRDALFVSLVLFFGSVLLGLVFVTTVPRLLSVFVKPCAVYPLFGFHDRIHRAIARMTGGKFFTRLFGDSSYIVHYLRWLGYDLGQVVQTGSNFGTDVGQENPYMSIIGSGTMVADGLHIMNADVSATSFRVSPVYIGADSFFGNNIFYPAGGRVGDNCLIATKAMIPLDGKVREGVGLLGSPPFEIPRTVERDQAVELDEPERRRRLRAKNRHNLRTIGIFLFARWLHVFLVTAFALAAFDSSGGFAQLEMGILLAVSVMITPVYFVLVERLVRGFRLLQPQYCSIYDPYFWRHERLWKVPAELYVRMFDGTPFKNLIWRGLGAKVGKRVFDDGCHFTERSLTIVGDDVTLNAGSEIQCHSQEDGAFKSDRTTIGSGCTIGVGALVHYGVTMGERSVLAPDSFLMKGEEIPPHARWGETPRGRCDMTTISPAKAFVDSDREFWHGVLTGGGFTPIPRWTLDPVPGVAACEALVPGDLLPALRKRGAELGVPLSSVLLAAHATVLAALSGESEVVTGYLAGIRGVPLPCRLDAAPGSWREILRQAHRTEWELLAHQDFPVGDLAGELGLAGPAFETVFDALGGEGTLAPGTVLWVSIWPHRGRLTLRLRYRTDVLDADAATRIAGYHLTALALIAADPAAEHERQTLLSPAELGFQLDGLAGPDRKRPARRMHELFEQRVRMQPDAIAAACGDRQWTYAELNARANRLARALLARGLRREGVVAVVTERNLDWMAAVLAIFKAGGVYLPIEPHFPADRIARTLSRAGCELVLTEPGSTATLGPALDGMPAVRTLYAEDAYRENHADDDPGIEAGPDQLAYIYFTSGSTGEPKGAMCEHAGMLNHLFAKIEDLEIGAGQVVAQTAPQCFDISMWQLVSALLAGGRTLLVEQEVILDVARFVDTIADGRVNVLQVVPSYLEVVLSYLDQNPRELPDLRYVSVTGEALKRELAQRWFAAKPGIRLVNAYGLTETSDDTNHEVMDAAPDGERVPLGRPVSNVRVYVVDEDLRPVPLGTPGLIAFSGVCVGRGYINDPERSRQCYMTDPHREGQRLYLGGDYGRWRPDGKLEFLGRRDSQVKISGFRIEIGEIENTLLRVPGVRDGAVVVAARPGQGQRLMAFYSGPGPIEAGTLRDRLGESLPWYMVPAAFHWRESLPLTANSKIDKKSLTALAGELGDAAAEGDYDAPGTLTERRLAQAWAKVLGIPQDQISRHDNFFDRGGSSLLAVKLAIALDRAVSLKELTRHPVLADMAGLIDGKSERRSGLLQPLLEPPGPGTTLVCFPYAGGNAVNFQSMAGALGGSGLAVYAVELPGHDLAGQDEPFASMAQVVAQVTAEITGRGLSRVLLWGHSSGAAFALATATKLAEAGVEVERVFLGAQLPGDAAGRRASVTELTGRSNAEIAAALSADGGYTELGELDALRTGQIGAAYRHDCVSAHRYLADALDRPPAAKLSAPVTVVVAADDPSTSDSAVRYRDWGFVAGRLDRHELADGGHYFLRTRPADAAQAVLVRTH